MQPTLAQPPVANAEPHVTNLHGTELRDEYAWLRDKGSPRVTAYLESENAYTAAAMSGTESLQAGLYEEMLSHIQEDDSSVPYRDGKWEYITRTEKGRQYARYCRRPVEEVGLADESQTSAESAEQVILDVNQLAEGQPFMSVGALSLSPDGRLLAYSTDNTGFRQYTLAIKDLETGALLPDTAERVGSVAWAADSTTLFFSTEDEQTKRQDRLFRRSVGTTEPSTEVFHEPDERFNLGVGRTRDRRYLLMDIGSHTTSESWFLDAFAPTGTFTRIAERVDDEEYDVDHRNGFFYIRTNLNADQFRLVRTPVDSPSREHWEELIPEQADAPLNDFDLFQNFLVTNARERGLPVLRVFSLDADGKPQAPREIRFPDPAYSAGSEVNRDFNADTFRYSYVSLVRPASVFRYDLATGGSTLLKQQAVPGGFDASLYASERLWFAAHDGTQIPVSLVYRKDKFTKNSTSPLYVYGYGS
ncbi:MAG: oligopeptidase B, partial [Janthinobacterium lividum]